MITTARLTRMRDTIVRKGAVMINLTGDKAVLDAAMPAVEKVFCVHGNSVFKYISLYSCGDVYVDLYDDVYMLLDTNIYGCKHDIKLSVRHGSSRDSIIVDMIACRKYVSPTAYSYHVY